jgi:hypothetical protein
MDRKEAGVQGAKTKRCAEAGMAVCTPHHAGSRWTTTLSCLHNRPRLSGFGAVRKLPILHSRLSGFRGMGVFAGNVLPCLSGFGAVHVLHPLERCLSGFGGGGVFAGNMLPCLSGFGAVHILPLPRTVSVWFWWQGRVCWQRVPCLSGFGAIRKLPLLHSRLSGFVAGVCLLATCFHVCLLLSISCTPLNAVCLVLVAGVWGWRRVVCLSDFGAVHILPPSNAVCLVLVLSIFCPPERCLSGFGAGLSPSPSQVKVYVWLSNTCVRAASLCSWLSSSIRFQLCASVNAIVSPQAHPASSHIALPKRATDLFTS